jgi:hypothetical protein
MRLLLLALVTTACTPYAMSPAARLLPLESVATTRAGHVALSAQGGAYEPHDLPTGTAALRVGATDDVEVQFSGLVAWLGLLSQRNVSPWVVGGRVGVRHRVERWLAFRGGLTAGGGPWGAFGVGDLGVVFAYENPDIVPFIAADVQLSVPLVPTSETATIGGSMPTMIQISPAPTFWFQPSGGFRIPICRRDEQCDGTRVSLLVAASWTQGYSIDGHGWGAFGGEGGLLVEP